MWIVASDVLHAIILRFILDISQRKEGELERCQQYGIENPNQSVYQVLCYLGKVINYQTTLKYSNIKDFQYKWLGTTAEYQFLFIILDKARNIIESLDSFVDFCDSLKAVFEQSADGSDNELPSPNKIMPNSAFGAFVRKLVAAWTTYSFPEQCVLYETTKRYLDDPEQLTQYQCSSIEIEEIKRYLLFQCSSFTIPGQSSGESLLSYKRFIEETELCLEIKNFSRAEDLVHDYFDGVLNANAPMMFFIPDPPTEVKDPKDPKNSPADPTPEEIRREFFQHSHLSYAISKTFQELIHHTTMSGYPLLKHQHSMIALAIIYVAAKNYQYAQIAIEEALKTAHQRGDHPAVIKCLLILFEICEKTTVISTTSSLMNNQISPQHGILASVTNPEELLRRCLEKSGNLSLSDTFNESILKFLSVHINNCATTTGIVDDTMESHSNSQEWTVSQLLNLLSFTTQSELPLALKYSLSKVATQLEDTTGAGPNPPHAMAPQLMKVGNTVIERLPLNMKYFDCYSRVIWLTNSLWSRLHCQEELSLGQSLLPLLNVVRLTYLYGKYYTYNQFADILTQTVFQVVSIVFRNGTRRKLSLKRKNLLLKAIIFLYRSCLTFNKDFQNIISHERFPLIECLPRSYQSSGALAMECMMAFMLFLIADLKQMRTQSIKQLDRILNILEVERNISMLKVKDFRYYDSQYYEKEVFVNPIFRFEDTIKMFLLRFVTDPELNKSHDECKSYVQKFLAYYRLPNLIHDSILRFYL